MFSFKFKNNLERKEKRLIKKLKSDNRYSFWLSIFKVLFSPVKHFLIAWKKWFKRIWWIVSFSIYKFFHIKIWYIDDFIVHKKSRGKWVWKKLLLWALEKIENLKCNYALLVSHKKRKKSHNIYKKFWFSIVSFGLFVLAYKKIKKDK